MMTNIFERASKQKLRFEAGKGLIAVEDLWDLSLQSLDKLAKATNKELKESDDESFIKAKSTANTELNLKMDLLKHVIQYKLDLADAAKVKAAKAAELEQLKAIYADKAHDELKGMSKEDLAKKIAELESNS